MEGKWRKNICSKRLSITDNQNFIKNDLFRQVDDKILVTKPIKYRFPCCDESNPGYFFPVAFWTFLFLFFIYGYIILDKIKMPK